MLGSIFDLFFNFFNASGALEPKAFRENREAGEIPARSRHCEVLEAADTSATDMISGRPSAAGARASAPRD